MSRTESMIWETIHQMTEARNQSYTPENAERITVLEKQLLTLVYKLS